MAGSGAMLVARTEGLLHDPGALTSSIDRLVAFAAAGADCLFAPGVRNPADIATMVRAVAPKPLSVLVLDPAVTLRQFADLGVRRLSVGGSLARVAWDAMLKAAETMKAGSFADLADGAPRTLLNGVFDTFG
jgi:PEP phosphonomutase and related enzymes